MQQVICPNCRTVVPQDATCASCGEALGFASATTPPFSSPHGIEGAPLSANISIADYLDRLSSLELFSRDVVPFVRDNPTISDEVTVERLALAETVEVPTDVEMDPRLQRLMLYSQKGIRSLATTSTFLDEVAVIAKVTDYHEWNATSEVRPGIVVENSTQMEEGSQIEYIVTGRIPVQRVEYVRSLPFVLSLKASQRLEPALARTIEETEARGDLLPPESTGKSGEGAVIGIVDFGCDFAHENFRNPDGTTRIRTLWNQNGRPTGSSSAGYGRVYSREEINAALQLSNPYDALSYGPAPDTPLTRGAHGTHVMDIAAGNGRGSGVPGIAPNADIIFVEVSTNDIPWSGPDVVEKSFGDSVQLLEAIHFIFEQAGERPCVVNISLGTNGGPHDGTTLVEQGIDSLLGQGANRAVVIAAGNTYADGIHTSGSVKEGEAVDITWQISRNDGTDNEMEIWYAGSDRLTAELIGPDGSSVLTVAPGQSLAKQSGKQIVLFIANRLNEPNNGDNMIGLFMERGLPTGDWTVRLHGTKVQEGDFHAWIERDDNGQSQFPSSHDQSCTLCSISCGQRTLAVGSYDANKETRPLSWFSSAGPTRDGRLKPEISAPGHNVEAAHSRTGNRVVAKSGTSMAAPVITGIIALMLSEAESRNLALNFDEITEIVTQSVRHDPPAGPDWNPQYGFGRVSALLAVQEVIRRASA